MEEFSTKENFDSQIKNIWNNDKFKGIEIIKHGYVLQDKNIKNCLLFVGINPSFDGKESVPENTGNYYDLNQNGLIHKYFKKFHDISRQVNLQWSHTDLLFVRETNQNCLFA